MTSLLVLIDRLLTMTCFSRPVFGWCLFDGVCVHCAVHDQHGHESLWGFVGWVVKWIIVSLTSGFHPLGCCLFVVLVVLARGLHPVSFPNLEVKPFCADGTATGRLWESRALPTVSLSGGGVDPLGLAPPPLFCLCFQPPPLFLCLCGGVVFGGGCWTTPNFFVRLEEGRHR